MSRFTLGVFLLVAAVLYTALGVMFYTPESGFRWLALFVLATGVVIGGMVWLLVREANRQRRERDGAGAGERSQR